VAPPPRIAYQSVAAAMPAGREPGTRPCPSTPAVDDQLEFFAIDVTVTAIDPRDALGEGTRVRGLWKVAWPGERRPHLVYHDRHGWYCEEHGASCRAVAWVRAQ
jgi:hypothetical protein